MRFLSCGAICLLTGALVLGACAGDEAQPDASTSAPGVDGGTPSTPTVPNDPTPQPETSLVTTTSESMSVNGKDRVYLLSVPRNLDRARSYPLVMELHGSPSTAEYQHALGPYDRASGADAIVVYPQAATAGDGSFNWDLSSTKGNNADIALLEALPNELKNKGFNVDPTKVFGYGYSGGGYFLQVYQCLGVDVFRAVYASAGGAPESLSTDSGGPITQRTANGCVRCPGTPVPEIIAFGQNAPSQGGDFQALCHAEAAGGNTSLPEGNGETCVAYQGCPTQRPVTYCKVPGLGHEDWSEAIPRSWAFFETFL